MLCRCTKPRAFKHRLFKREKLYTIPKQNALECICAQKYANVQCSVILSSHLRARSSLLLAMSMLLTVFVTTLSSSPTIVCILCYIHDADRRCAVPCPPLHKIIIAMSIIYNHLLLALPFSERLLSIRIVLDHKRAVEVGAKTLPPVQRK